MNRATIGNTGGYNSSVCVVELGRTRGWYLSQRIPKIVIDSPLTVATRKESLFESCLTTGSHDPQILFKSSWWRLRRGNKDEHFRTMEITLEERYYGATGAPTSKVLPGRIYQVHIYGNSITHPPTTAKLHWTTQTTQKHHVDPFQLPHYPILFCSTGQSLGDSKYQAFMSRLFFQFS